MKVLNDAHNNEYEKKPEVVVKAPGRFHLIGEHSWFFKDKTLSMAVNIPVYVAVSKRTDSSVKFHLPLSGPYIFCSVFSLLHYLRETIGGSLLDY